MQIDIVIIVTALNIQPTCFHSKVSCTSFKITSHIIDIKRCFAEQLDWMFNSTRERVGPGAP